MTRPTTAMLSTLSVFLLGIGLSPRPARALQCEANLMIVLDRSCTMRDVVDGSGGRTKWEVALGAIQEITSTHATDIDYGLILFPEPRDDGRRECEQIDDIPIPVGPDNAGAIRRLLNHTPVGGPCETNIDAAIDQVSDDPAFSDIATNARRGYVLLITDGRQSRDCGADAGDARTLEHIGALYAAGYPTFVVGFGTRSDDVRLNEFAVAGGVPRVGAPQDFYHAVDEVTLRDALGAISGIVAGDGEFGLQCEGVPCPDGRCFGAGHRCVDGVCVPDSSGGASDPRGDDGTPDAGTPSVPPAAIDGGGASPSAGGRPFSPSPATSPGCACTTLGETPSHAPGGYFAVLVVLALARRRLARLIG